MLPRVYPFGESGPYAVFFTGLGIDCFGFISQYVGYGLACTDGHLSGNDTSWDCDDSRGGSVSMHMVR